MTDTLLTKLKTDKEFALHDAYAADDRLIRFGRIKGSCLYAASVHDDAGALRLYELILLASDDVHGGPDSEKAKMERALVAIDLYRALPEFRKSRECVDRETYEMADVKNQTLVGLKKRILTDVAQRWSATKAEDEANVLARFLVEVAQKRDRHDAERLTEALREATNRIWKKERAIALMTRFLAETDVDGERNPFRVLLIGVARSLGRNETLSVATLLLHLPLDSLRGGWNELGGDAVITALERDAESYRGMHDAMAKLRQALKADRGQIHAFVPSYPRPGRVELTIVASRSFSARGEEENDFHDLAGAIRDQVRDWLAAHQAAPEDALAVQLIVQFPPGAYAAKDAPPRYQRRFDLR